MAYRIEIRVGNDVKRVVTNLNRLSPAIWRKIMQGFVFIGERIQGHVRTSMSKTLRAPWFYTKGGKRFIPSMPGHPPAVQSGTLYNAIRNNVTGQYPNGLMSVGPDDSPEAFYGKFLEKGWRTRTGKYVPARPFMAPAYYNHPHGNAAQEVLAVSYRKTNEAIHEVMRGTS